MRVPCNAKSPNALTGPNKCLVLHRRLGTRCGSRGRDWKQGSCCRTTDRLWAANVGQLRLGSGEGGLSHTRKKFFGRRLDRGATIAVMAPHNF